MSDAVLDAPPPADESNIDLTAQQNIAMLGDGFYSRVSAGPKAVIDNTADLVLDAIDRLEVTSPATLPFTVADYGSADGGTSLDLVRAVVDRASNRFGDRPISLHYTDLPGADFGTLFRQTDGEHDHRVHAREDVHVFASGRSFHRQILPTASLHLGFSASAMHYLSTMPATIADHVHSVRASATEHEPFRRVAQRDWETILWHRSAELAPGGRLVMANFVVDDDGRHLGNTGGHHLFDTYNELWQGLRDEGAITAAEYRSTAFQQHYKSIEDSLRPLTDADHPVRRSGLRLEHVETRIVECPFRLAFEAGELPAPAFAQQFVNTHRSWTETTFRAGLSSQRSPNDAQAVLDELYRRYESRVRGSPAGHGKDLLHQYIVAAKE